MDRLHTTGNYEADDVATVTSCTETSSVATSSAAGPTSGNFLPCTQRDATLNPLWKHVLSSEQLLNCKVQGSVAPIAPCAPCAKTPH
jgi:hypothetical protein